LCQKLTYNPIKYSILESIISLVFIKITRGGERCV